MDAGGEVTVISSMSSALRIAIIEDDPRYRASLEELFSQAGNFQLGGSFAAPPAAFAEAEGTMRDRHMVPWDVVVMDLDRASSSFECVRSYSHPIDARIDPE